jgi:hypothetical protein
VSERKQEKARRFVEALKRCGDIAVAMKKTGVTEEMINAWCGHHPDFGHAISEAIVWRYRKPTPPRAPKFRPWGKSDGVRPQEWSKDKARLLAMIAAGKDSVAVRKLKSSPKAYAAYRQRKSRLLRALRKTCGLTSAI